MAIKDEFSVISIPKEQLKEWLEKKHYAKRKPSIMFSFGLYRDNLLCGVCSYGMPPVHFNFGAGIFENYIVDTFELTRLVVNDGLKRNVLSFFVSQSLKLLKTPSCIVSFADPNNGHHGYIYQATNWLYTGLTQKGGKDKQWIMNGKSYHAKTITVQWMINMKFKYDHTKNMTENWIANGGTVEENELQKFRYIFLIGNKKEIKEMRKAMVLKILPYPKGDNNRYDSGYNVQSQMIMF